MSTDDNILKNLISFLRIATGTVNLPLGRETLIEDGLGVTGDDGIDLINSFSKKYKVDITHFDFDKYFHEEPGIGNFQNKIIHPLAISHLENAIIAGKLDEEVINGWKSSGVTI